MNGPVETSPDPICSVCIANYNGIGLIERCLDSIFNQTDPPAFEIIVHDDASTDESADLIAQRYPAVRLIRSDANVGFCIGNNRMADIARGRYLLLLNNDAVLRPDALSSLYAHATAAPRAEILSLPQFDMETGELIDRGMLLDPFLNPKPNLDPSVAEVAMVIGACLWIPRTVWVDCEGFPPWFESLAEDMQLCCCARLLGHPVRMLQASGYDHRVGGSFGGGKVVSGGLSSTYRRRSLSERNKTFTMLTCYPFPIMQVVLPLHLFALVTEGVVLSLLRLDRRILGGIYLPVFASLWRHRRELTRTRKRLQGRRTVSRRLFFRPFTPLPWKLVLLFRHGVPKLR